MKMDGRLDFKETLKIQTIKDPGIIINKEILIKMLYIFYKSGNKMTN